MTALYVDLLINNHTLVLNAGNEPILCDNEKSIGQDTLHGLLESNLITALLAERSPTLRADIFNQMEVLIENDERIVPGTVTIKEESRSRLFITAQTYEFGVLSYRVNL